MSIVHLANDLGLSVSTVSRALNGYTDVSDSTRQRVALRAQELGYKPHPGARRLKSGKSGAIGVVLPSISQGGQFIDAMYASLLGGMAMVLEAEGYTLMATSHGPCTDEQELGLYENFIRGGWFEAFVIVRTRLDDPRVALVQAQKVPFVTYGRCQNADSFAWVDTDNEQAFYLGAQRQLAFGHRDVALINGPSDYTFAQLRRAGYERALEEAGLAVRPEWVVQGPVTEGSGYELAQALLNLPQPPSAWLCATDAMAIGAMAACRDRGLEVGRDIAIMGYGNSESGRYTNPGLTTIAHDVHENGRHVAQVLLAVLRGADPADLHYLEPVVLVPRGSDDIAAQASRA
jgi:LacI family transcriptional regulator